MTDQTAAPTADDVFRAVYGAALDLMDATGYYPMTREDVLDAVRQGVENAFLTFMREGYSPLVRGDILGAIREGVADASSGTEWA